MPFTVAADTRFQVSTNVSPGTATFGQTAADLLVTIPAGESTASFTYLNTQVGSVAHTIAATWFDGDPLLAGRTASQATMLVPAAATQLGLHAPPSASAVAQEPFAQQPVVRVLDSYGNRVTTDSTTQVSASAQVSGGILLPLGTATAQGGVVQFSSLAYRAPGTVQLVFSAPGLTSATSGDIMVGPDPIPPTVTLVSTATTSGAGALSVSVTVSEPALVTLERRIGANWVNVGSGRDLETGVHTITLALTEGNQQYRAVAVDTSDNPGQSEPITITYTPPAPPPAPTVTAVTEKLRTSLTKVEITGRATGSSSLWIEQATQVIETILLRPDGTYVYLATLAEGKNAYTVVTIGPGGRTSAIIEIERDSTPPIVVLEAPDEVEVDTAEVKVTTEPGATVHLGDAEVGIAGSDGIMVLKVDLMPGTTTFTVTVSDDLGNRSEAKTIPITRKTTPLSLEVNPIPDSTTATSLTISGTTGAESQLTVSVNGGEESRLSLDSAGAFVATVELVLGTNQITVTTSNGTDQTSVDLVTERVAVPLPPTPEPLPPAPIQPPAPPKELPPDVIQHWASSAVERLIEAGVVQGYEDGNFRPEGEVTRAEFAKLIVSALGIEVDPSDALHFADGDDIADWAKPYVAAAVRAGLINGFEDGSFRGGLSITRLQIAVILTRGLALKGIIPSGAARTFTDDGDVPAWGTTFIESASAAGLINGFEDGSFRPGERATRAQAAIMTLRLMDK